MATYIKKCNADCEHRIWGGNRYYPECSLMSVRLDSSGNCIEFAKTTGKLYERAKWDPYAKYSVLSDIEEIEPIEQLPFITKDYSWGKVEITGLWGFSPRVGCARGVIKIKIFNKPHSQITGWQLESQHFGWETPKDPQPRWAIEVLNNSEEVSGPEEAIAKAKAWTQREIQKYK